jgi:Kef-type K+ transport system membrane component KefB
VAREVGVGMIPRGEVGIVVAGIALGTGVMSDDIYAAVIGMVLVTTIAGPFLIKLGYGGGDGGTTRGRRSRERDELATPTPGGETATTD